MDCQPRLTGSIYLGLESEFFFSWVDSPEKAKRAPPAPVSCTAPGQNHSDPTRLNMQPYGTGTKKPIKAAMPLPPKSRDIQL